MFEIFQKNNASNVYYYGQIANTDRRLYDAVLQGIRDCAAVITLSAHAGDKLKTIIKMVLHDHPELFWIDSSYETTLYADKMELRFNYLYGKQEIARRSSKIEAAVSAFKRTLSFRDTEYDMIRKAYLYVIDTVEYVANASDNQNIYSSLVNRRSVCAGYSRALQYLLQRNGIQAIYVSGTANGNGFGVGKSHAWNIVRCKGRYYQVDATFADAYGNPDRKMIELGIHNLAYLCIDDNTMYRNHTPSRELQLPECRSKDLNYFVKNGLYAETYNDRVKTNMKDAVYQGKHTWCYQFSNYNAYSACLHDIENGRYSKLVSEYTRASSRIHYTHDEAMYCITCWY